MTRLLLGLLLALLPLAGQASSIEELKALLRGTTTARAQFAQIVLDKDLNPIQQASGSMAFARPGRFRWEYSKPYEQVIVGDGTSLWIYDKDLNQVTVRRLEGALGASPAALLAGSNEIEKGYALSSVGSEQGLDWLEAVPKDQDTVFERIRLGFSKTGLEAMELRDRFGQITVIKFTAVKRNSELPSDWFSFTPPEGADVIRE
ncbi:MAG: outer membrane lipoprotein chaperone LolA [Burkholderiales bacterium]